MYSACMAIEGYHQHGRTVPKLLIQQPGLMVVEGEQHRKKHGVDLLTVGIQHALAEHHLAAKNIRGEISPDMQMWRPRSGPKGIL